MSIDGNGEKRAISCVKPNIITVTVNTYTQLRNSMHP